MLLQKMTFQRGGSPVSFWLWNGGKKSPPVSPGVRNLIKQITSTSKNYKDSVLHVLILNDGENENKMTPLFIEAMSQLKEDIESTEENATLLILNCNSKFFSFGGDVKSYQILPPEEKEHYKKKVEKFLIGLHFWKIPIVVCARGWAMGAGAFLLMVADYGFMKEKSFFGFPEITYKMPFVPSIIEILRLQADQRAIRELIFLGKSVKSEEARQMKLVNEVLPSEELLTKAIQKAWEFTQVDRPTFVQNKKLYYHPLHKYLV